MIFNKQPAPGHCFRSAISCLLDLEVEDVPHFLTEDGQMYADMQQWLNSRGYHMIRLKVERHVTDQPILEWVSNDAMAEHGIGPDLRYLLFGSEEGESHVVVCEGDQIIHNTNGGPLHLDPSATDETGDWRWWIVAFVVRLDPAVCTT